MCARANQKKPSHRRKAHHQQNRNLNIPSIRFLGFIALLLLAANAWLSTVVGKSLWFAIALRNAVPAKASILDIEYVVNSGKGPSRHVYVTYTYTYHGQQYTNRTRQLTSFAYSSSVEPQIRAAFERGEEITCYVDPEAPERSVFSKEISVVGVLFSLLFPIVFGWGFVVMLRSLFVYWQQSRLDNSVNGV
ncbi:MAG: DUF3592 domain-containing protein [Planctomycetota bacterium]